MLELLCRGEAFASVSPASAGSPSGECFAPTEKRSHWRWLIYLFCQLTLPPAGARIVITAKEAAMKPIYKLWLMNYQQAWYNLDEAKQQDLGGKISNCLAQNGAKSLLTAVSLWADEKWAAFGIEEFPDIEAVMKHSQALNELQWCRYIKCRSSLGTLIWPESNLTIPEAPLYRLAQFKMNEVWYHLSDAEKKAWDEKNEQAYNQVGAQIICGCDTSWSNEEWGAWVLETYPSLEAAYKHTMVLGNQGWYQYAKAISVLGVKYSPV
jgi:hypothetical protein